MPTQIKTFRDYFGKENITHIKQIMEQLFQSPAGCVIIIMPSPNGHGKPRITDAYYNIHANYVRGIIEASLRDAIKEGLLMEGYPIKCYVGNSPNSHDKHKQGAKLCLTGAKTH